MIRNIVFDLSEVLIPGIIGVEKTLADRFGVTEPAVTRALGSHPHYEVGNRLDCLLNGSLTYEEYQAAVLSDLGCGDSDCASLFDQSCLAMFDDAYIYTDDLIHAAAKIGDLYMISDHCEFWVKHIFSIHPFMSVFKDIVWSYEIGATKRDTKPFETLLKRHDLKAEECLFIDDQQRNIKKASSMGMATFHFSSPACADELLQILSQGVRADSPSGHHSTLKLGILP